MTQALLRVLAPSPRVTLTAPGLSPAPGAPPPGAPPHRAPFAAQRPASPRPWSPGVVCVAVPPRAPRCVRAGQGGGVGPATFGQAVPAAARGGARGEGLALQPDPDAAAL